MSGWEPESEFLRELNAKARAEALVEGEAIGEVRGVAIGKAEGVARGRQALLDALLSLLHHRFGALSPEHEAHLQSASIDTLQGWFKGALTAPSIDAALQDFPEAQ